MIITTLFCIFVLSSFTRMFILQTSPSVLCDARHALFEWVLKSNGSGVSLGHVCAIRKSGKKVFRAVGSNPVFSPSCGMKSEPQTSCGRQKRQAE